MADKSPKTTRFHNIFVNTSSGSIQINGSTYNFTVPPHIRRIVVASDVHGVRKYAKLFTPDYDLRLIPGDVSITGQDVEFYDSFAEAPRIPTLISVGNHDEIGDWRYLI